MLERVLFVVICCASFLVEAQDTVLKLYRPYGEAWEQALPAVQRSLKGHCRAQSQIIVREDAWRCEAEGTVYDPCFVKAGKNRTEALCPQSPWVGDSVEVKVPAPLNNEVNKTLDMSRTYPWAVELSDGARCLAIKTTDLYDGMPIRYSCGSKNLLVGHLQRCKSAWSMIEKTPEGENTVDLVKAWF